MGHVWWDDDQCKDLNLLRYCMNPVRMAYFRRTVDLTPSSGGAWQKVLEVGCGGGYLTEEFAKAGFDVAGIDPAQASLDCARQHAAQGDLSITYVLGSGEQIPFSNASFDIVLCCDVLEHVNSVDRVLGEIARVLRPRGLFFFDTVNRTLASWLGVIKMMQDWQSNSHGARVHVWHKFIKPHELVASMAENGLEGRDLRGFGPSIGILSQSAQFLSVSQRENLIPRTCRPNRRIRDPQYGRSLHGLCRPDGHVTVHAPLKPVAKSPVKPSTPVPGRIQENGKTIHDEFRLKSLTTAQCQIWTSSPIMKGMISSRTPADCFFKRSIAIMGSWSRLQAV